MDIRIQCLCIDATDPAGLAKFWQAVLGWRLEAGPGGNEFCVLRALAPQDRTYEGV